jgi:transketolase
VLTKRGYFPENLLDTYGEDGSLFAEHPPAHGIPGIEAATGSLGHGLSLAIGMMLGMQLAGQPGRVFALLGDGECNEGSVWEAAMMASAQRLDRLTVIVDYNKWQATARSNEVLSLAPLDDKWSAFGWSVTEVDGHDIGALLNTFTRLPFQPGKPSAIIAHTVKGKGVSFMEDDNNWHYRTPNPAEVQRSRCELGLD